MHCARRSANSPATPAIFRDKRGYGPRSSSTRFSRGKTGQRIFTGFGRPRIRWAAALDEDAIRWIEEHNPDVTFDWAKILEAKAPVAVPDDSRSRRSQRARPEPPQLAERQEAVDAGPPASGILGELEPEEERVVADVIAEHVQKTAEALTTSEASDPALEPVIDAVRLTKLRARFAELQARITERGGDPGSIAVRCVSGRGVES